MSHFPEIRYPLPARRPLANDAAARRVYRFVTHWRHRTKPSPARHAPPKTSRRCLRRPPLGPASRYTAAVRRRRSLRRGADRQRRDQSEDSAPHGCHSIANIIGQCFIARRWAAPPRSAAPWSRLQADSPPRDWNSKSPVPGRLTTSCRWIFRMSRQPEPIHERSIRRRQRL